MSAKQDRSYARTAQDIERKYSFGKTFGEMLGLINDTRDKVDSVESEFRDEIKEQTTALRRDSQEIVLEAEERLTQSIADVSNSVADLSSKVEMKLDAEAVRVEIEKEISDGVDRVVTKTGYVFDEDGLSISKEGEEIKNKLDNTGMYVKKQDEEILTANKDGVKATDLHAKTFLIIGAGNGRSRFEDYGADRTACFWIGGNS